MRRVQDREKSREGRNNLQVGVGFVAEAEMKMSKLGECDGWVQLGECDGWVQLENRCVVTATHFCMNEEVSEVFEVRVRERAARLIPVSQTI